MKVERITEEKLIISILKVPDERLKKQVLDFLQCSLVEWAQFLQQFVKDEKAMGIWGTVVDDKLKYYIVAMNSVLPPISRGVILLYQNYFAVKDDDGSQLGLKAFEMVKEWARSIGATKLTTFTQYPRIMSRFGFLQEKGSSVYLPL